jgi:glycosyltransferase involved in cell wall biosynthesis
MTKILLVANTDWYLYRYRLSLARFLRAQGLEVVLVSPAGAYAPLIAAEGFRWLAWRLERQSINPFQELRAVISLARILRRERPTLVHLHTIKPVLYGSLAARLVGVPAVVRSITGRGYVFLGQERRARLLRPLVSVLYRFLLFGKGKAAIFENDADRQYFLDQRLVRPAGVHLIEGVGVDTEYYRPLPEPTGTPVILLASRMLWDKGVGTLVEAARLLHSRMEVRVVLAGEPDEGNPASIPLETLRGWNEEKVVEWWGWQEDMRTVYESCHIVTLPSLGEGLPTTLLEAAACGRPLVATDVPGCRDVVRHGVNGFLVPPGEARSLAEALGRLAQDQELRFRMGTAGRLRVEARFADRSINAQTLEVYRSLVETSA